MEEQTNNQQHGHSMHKKAGNSSKMLISGVVIVVVAGLGFFGGMQYQKGKTSTAATASQQTNGYGTGSMNGGFGGPTIHRGEFGAVTAVSSTSISLKSERSGETKTYTINSSTTFTKDSASATASDVAVGDTVMVEANSSDSSVASSVVINPSMNGGPMNSSGTSTQTN